MQLVKNLADVTFNDLKFVGGKAAGLGEMKKIGLPVPDGFVILPQAFELFLRNNGILLKKIKEELAGIDYHNAKAVEKASAGIRRLIFDGSFPSVIMSAVKDAFGNMKTVAVRSSSACEDSFEHAWAGQLDSFLNTTRDNLLDNIKRCWASLFTSRAIYYRFENKLDKKPLRMSIIVQNMVKSEASGVIFSVDPVSQNRDLLVIEAGSGVGEAIVSGKVTPDRYLVDKARGVIVDKIIASQNNALLSDKEILQLNSLAKKIEKRFGFAVDVEWAIAKGKMYLLQCRPITTLVHLSDANKDVADYIKSQDWFFGVRAEDSLLFYSARIDGQRKYLRKMYGLDFIETVLAPRAKDFPVRVFNKAQAKIFHANSRERVIKKPELLLQYLQREEKNWQDIFRLCVKLNSAVENGKFNESVNFFSAIMDKYGYFGCYFQIIFSLGMKLTENAALVDRSVADILKAHDNWRNKVTFDEDKLNGCIEKFAEFAVETKKLNIGRRLLVKYLTLSEMMRFVRGKLDIAKLITNRKNKGYVFAGLRGWDNKPDVIDDKHIVRDAAEYFNGLIENQQKTAGAGVVIKGQSVLNASGKIKGIAIVIKNKEDLPKNSARLKNKILVTVQTSPHFIPYLKSVKAIITDEGGITCHAAIIAREMKKPCVVGTGVATKRIKTGDLLIIDSQNSSIEITNKK